MSMKYYGDVCSTTGEYEKDGQTKKRSVKIGAAFQDDQTGRISIKLEALPMCKVDDKGYPCAWLSIFQNDNQQTQPTQQASQPSYTPPEMPPASDFTAGANDGEEVTF